MKVEWLANCKTALEWFIDIIGVEEWHSRRAGVVKYFQSLERRLFDPSMNVEPKYEPIAIYEDWMSWYMFLVECMLERPACNDPVQASRIMPFFITIGKNLDQLKAMNGIEDRIRELLNNRKNQPDATLFELAVALLYSRNGWKVSFLKEIISEKTPDMQVYRKEEFYDVECKRLAKVTDYSEKERLAWQALSQSLFGIMRHIAKPSFVEITFKIPIEDVPEALLPYLYDMYIQADGLSSQKIFSLPELDFKVSPIDIDKINVQLNKKQLRANSPDMNALVAGDYDIHGKYTISLNVHEYSKIGLEDDLHVLNTFVESIHDVYLQKYECLAESSIDRKAKDIKKHLSNAFKQISESQKGIIHIGYETVEGPLVEKARHPKIVETIQTFDYGNKHIEAIFCHAMRPLAKPEEWEWAETTSFFGEKASTILPSLLLVDLGETVESAETHWEQDLAESLK